MKTIAIIPARGGSKRIPKKNIKDFLGRPVISYAINAAINSKVFDKVIVSTDDKEIADISIKYGAEIPFFRSNENSSDNASTDDVLKEVIKYYTNNDEYFNNACCIYPVNPFINENKIIEGLNILNSNNFDCVFSAVKYSYPIQRAFIIDNENKIKMMNPENYLVRSQELEDTFHDAGQFYWFKTKSFMKENKLWTNNTSIIELNEKEVQDIDNESDWEVAEIKFKIQKNLNHN
jgi:N-acylneuraminate cytidylyltransferase